MRGLLRMFLMIISFGSWKMNKAADALAANPGVMQGEYDKIISAKSGKIKQFEDVLSEIEMNRSTRAQQLEGVTKQIEDRTKVQKGALAAMQKIAAKYGADKDKCEADTEFVKAKGAYTDCKSTVDQLNQRAHDLEESVKQSQDSFNRNMTLLQNEQRELQKLRTEKGDAVADVMAAKSEQQAADRQRNLASDGTDDRLAALRQVRQKAVASASVASKLSGADVKASEAEFLKDLSKSDSDSELDGLLGFKSAEAPAATTPTVQAAPTQVPEA